MGFNSKRNNKANKLFKKPAGQFEKIDLTKANHPSWMSCAYRNNVYTVMIADKVKTTHGFAIRAMVQKHNDTPILNHWSEMQKIKNELFGDDATAVEYYPAKKDLVDLHNIYWFWIYPEGVLPLPLNQ